MLEHFELTESTGNLVHRHRATTSLAIKHLFEASNGWMDGLPLVTISHYVLNLTV